MQVDKYSLCPNLLFPLQARLSNPIKQPLNQLCCNHLFHKTLGMAISILLSLMRHSP